MFTTIKNIFSIPELRFKILFTVAMLCIYRVGFHIPIPGYKPADNIVKQEDRDSGSGMGRVAEYLEMFSGGRLDKTSLFGLGIMPYISASIILMLLGEVYAPLKKLKEEGQSGYKKIQEYTRYLTVPLCILQAIMIMKVMVASGADARAGIEGRAAVMGVFGMTAGTIFLMWLGEQIDEHGIGNGISLIIMAGIVSRMPWAIKFVWDRAELRIGASSGSYGPGVIAVLIFAFLFVVAGAILITQGQRRIPIQQAKQMRGHRMYGGQRHYLPLRINHGGVMPIIFASSFMMFPPIIIQTLARIPALGDKAFMGTLQGAFRMDAFTYNILFVLMIYLFAYFWTSVQFQPKDMAKRLRDSGSFIPGLRPGHRTAEYLENVMMRITFYGASFLAFIAVVPSVVAQGLGVDYRVTMFLGGTGLLIVVSVSLDLVQKIEANLIMRNYEGFSSSGRIKGANG